MLRRNLKKLKGRKFKLNRKTIKEFLKPDWKKILIFGVFVFIAVGGSIQSWAFSDMPPKPPLYDLLAPFPFWITWIFLIMPLGILTAPFNYTGFCLFCPPYIYPLEAIYFYLLSCAVVSAYHYKDRINKKYFLIALLPVILIFLYLGFGSFVFGAFGNIGDVSATEIFWFAFALIAVFFVAVLYTYLIFCLITYLWNKFFKP